MSSSSSYISSSSETERILHHQSPDKTTSSRRRKQHQHNGVDPSAMALRALATRAGEAGRELMGVHTQLHQQSSRVDTVEHTLGLLHEGFGCLTDAQDNDRENIQIISEKNSVIEERQVRVLRRLKALKLRLEKEINATKAAATETFEQSKSRNEILSQKVFEYMDELKVKNTTLENKMEILTQKNIWLTNNVTTLKTELDATRQEMREQGQLSARMISEMERITTAVDGIGTRQSNASQDLIQRVADADKISHQQNQIFQATINETVQQLEEELQRKAEDTSIMLRASLKRQSLLRASVDDALTALATELRASLSMTGAVEKKCESIVGDMRSTDSENNMRFDAISQAIQALAAVVDTR